MKKVKACFLPLIIIAFLFLLVGCKDDSYDKLKTVKTEVDYNPIFVTNRGVSINNDEDYYVSKVKGIIDFDSKKHGNFEKLYYYDDSIFFVMEYDSYYSHNDRFVEPLGLTYEEEHLMCYTKLGFFKVNALTGSCELLEDLGKVYYTDLYGHAETPDTLTVINDSMAALTYNGKLKLYSLDSCEVVQSFDIYDPEEYCCFESGGPEYNIFPFSMYGDDYVAVFEDRVDYYKFNGKLFEKHTVESVSIGETFGVADNKFYSYTYWGDAKGSTPGLCFDTETFEILNLTIKEIDTLHASSDSSNQWETENKKYTVEHNGKYYNVTASGDATFNITDSDGQMIKVIDKALLDSNEKYIELVAIDKNCSYAAPEEYFVINGRLYFYCYGLYGWAASTPRFIFEYDFDSGSLKYAGMISQSSHVWKIIIQ